ncbi:beta-Ala-His dipeptidase-like isoform X1 [Diabrotica virgifera virgifera]|uniref:Beta-Ala-His dipeptidase-like n=2 Tax=Diabrotica virgifera virgifera TaxID=50390 RepID=A0A6P7FQB5_DIAVI|nr:beta-Ala-His dipeptidase-like isoform X1 [Diabrotica virgifera virgifera]
MVYPHAYRTEHSETQTTSGSYGAYFLVKQSMKIKIQPALLKIIQFIDSNRKNFLKDLEHAVKIRSITTDIQYRSDGKKMIKFIEDWLVKLDLRYECFNIGFYNLNGQKVRIPPVILASLGNDPNKYTVAAYMHADVPDPKGKPWKTDPWTLTEIDQFFYGNGAGCGKGPLMCWLHVIQAFRFHKMPLPVNLRLVIEMMHHQNSLGFSSFVATRRQDFFNSVDYVIECDGEWLGPKCPCIIYGTVGVLHFEMTIEAVPDSKTDIKEDMIKIFETIVDEKNNIIIPNFSDMVEQITPDEERMYEKINEFNIDEIRDSLPPHKKSWDQVRLLMSLWRLPQIFIDDIDECICDKKDMNIVKRHFIVKIVPRQIIDKTEERIQNHIKNVIKTLNINNRVTCKLLRSTRTWIENPGSHNFQAARKAMIQIYKQDPNLIREDRGRESPTVFDSVLEKNIVMVPLCSKNSNQAEANESISARCYYEGTKLLAAYMFQLAEKPKSKTHLKS